MDLPDLLEWRADDITIFLGHQMKSIIATYRNGQVNFTESVDWPEGIQVQIVPLSSLPNEHSQPMAQWPNGFFDELRRQWSDEPFERPPQGELEFREEW